MRCFRGVERLLALGIAVGLRLLELAACFAEVRLHLRSDILVKLRGHLLGQGHLVERAGARGGRQRLDLRPAELRERNHLIHFAELSLLGTRSVQHRLDRLVLLALCLLGTGGVLVFDAVGIGLAFERDCGLIAR